MPPKVEWKLTVPKVKILRDPFQNLDKFDPLVLADKKSEIEKARKLQQYLYYRPTSSSLGKHRAAENSWARYVPHTCHWTLDEKGADLDAALQHAMGLYDEFDMLFKVNHQNYTPGERYIAEMLAYDALNSAKGRSFAAEYMFNALVVVIIRHFNKMKWWDVSTRGR